MNLPKWLNMQEWTCHTGHLYSLDKQQKTLDASKKTFFICLFIYNRKKCISFVLHLDIFFFLGHIVAGVILVWGETEHPIALGNPLARLPCKPWSQGSTSAGLRPLWARLSPLSGILIWRSSQFLGSCSSWNPGGSGIHVCHPLS